MDGQLIVVEYNDRKNAFGGARDTYNIVDVENKLDIAKTIEAHLNQLKNGYVLVKYAGVMYLCERNNVDAKKPYIKHKQEYHPLMDKFTI